MPQPAKEWPRIFSHQIEDVLELELPSGNVVFLQGPPSSVKSVSCRNFAQKFRLFPIDVRIPQMQSEDLLGFPRIGESEDGRDVSQYVPFDFLPIESTPIPKGYDGFIIIWDEVNATNDDSVIAAMYKVLQEKEVGPYRLHPKTFQVACGNLIGDGAIAYELGTAFNTRVAQYVVQPSAEGLVKHARANNWDTRITSYLDWKPSHAHYMDPDTFDSQLTHACNRQWENLNKVLQRDPQITESTFAHPVIKSKLDIEVGNSFLAYCAYWTKLPTIEQIKLNPATARLPDSPGAKVATAASLAEQMADEENIPFIIQYMERLEKEYQTVWVREACQRNESLLMHPKMQPYKAKFAKELYQ